MDSLFDVSFEATNLLQIFANVGLCESDLNFEASITPGGGASSVSVQP